MIGGPRKPLAWLLAAVIGLTASAGQAQGQQQGPAPAGATVESPSQAPAPAAKANYELIIEAPEELLNPIRQRTLIGRWQMRPDYDPIQFEGLFERAKGEVESLMRAAGFFSGSVEISGDPASIRIVVDGGARTTVNQVEISFKGPAAQLPEAQGQRFREHVLRRWQLPEGSFFNAEFWDAGKRRLIDAFHQKGYLRARLTVSEARVDMENTSAALRIEVDSGPAFAFGAVRINGLQRYAGEIVQDLRPFREGDPYDYDRLILFQQRLRESGYFSTATALPDLIAVEKAEQPTVPIVVEVSEFRSKRIVTGIGFSSDQGARGQLGFEHRDLFDLGWQLESALLLEQKRQRAFINLRTPAQSEGHYWATGARIERLVPDDNETTLRSNFYFGRGRRVEEVEYFMSVQHQRERLDQNLTGVATRDYRQALVASYAWNMRRLDSRIDPRDGYTISAQFSTAVKGVVSETNFSRLYLRMLKFWPMSDEGPIKGSTLIGMAEFGQVFSSSSQYVPSENLFRAGGSQSLRGYHYLELGPAAVGLSIGGRSLAIASLEYQRPINNLLRWAAFIDVGNAADSFRNFKPAVGIGGGIRVKTPIGPVNADLAWGQASHQFVFHFSVGYVF